MSLHSIRLMGDTVLRTPSASVIDFGDSLQRLIVTMENVLAESKGVGLAAPQIGVPLRVFIWSCKEGKGALINPNLVNISTYSETKEEGCLSIPQLFAPRERAKRIEVNGYTATGQPVTIKAEGFLARIFQHELDHLDGKLFIDNLAESHREVVLKKIRHALANSGTLR